MLGASGVCVGVSATMSSDSVSSRVPMERASNQPPPHTCFAHVSPAAEKKKPSPPHNGFFPPNEGRDRGGAVSRSRVGHAGASEDQCSSQD